MIKYTFTMEVDGFKKSAILETQWPLKGDEPEVAQKLQAVLDLVDEAKESYPIDKILLEHALKIDELESNRG